MKILAIDTSFDETAAAVTEGRKVLSNVLYSQILTHKKWGGVIPSLARIAHQERIDMIINKALKNADVSFETIDYVAVTYGPGLAIALEVGIAKAQEIAQKYNKPLIPVNHMAGHIYSCFVQNSNGKPVRDFQFPYIALLVSGAHTEIVLFKDHLSYEILGETRDDAAGEALDKAARMIGLGYPGGPSIERLSRDVNNEDVYKFPRPMIYVDNLDFSFSGLKTAFLYHTKSMTEQDKNEKLRYLASSFQSAVFDTLIAKVEKAMRKTNVNNLVVGGGVIANKRLRVLLKSLAAKHGGTALFPSYKYLTQDNAAMIGVAAFYKVGQKKYISGNDRLERVPRLSLSDHTY